MSLTLRIATLLLSFQVHTLLIDTKALNLPRSSPSFFSPPINKTTTTLPKGLTARNLETRQGEDSSVSIAVIATHTDVDVGACVDDGGSVLGIELCYEAGIAAITLSFGEVGFLPNDLGLTKRTAGTANIEVLPQFQATTSCSVACQMKAATLENTWTLMAGTSIHNITHDIHFLHTGSTSALRAVPSKSPHTSKRQAIDFLTESVDSDIFLEYYFADEFVDAWVDWDFTDASLDDFVAEFVGPFAAENNALFLCMVFFDELGFADSGFLTTGFNNDERSPSLTEIEDFLSECNNL